jgi:hypothetical protein
LLHDGEREETMNDSKKMVVAAWANAGARFQKVVDQGAIDCVPIGDVVALEVTVEETQDFGIGAIFAI